MAQPNKSFVKLYRKALKSIVWQNKNVWRYWTWALMKATYKKYVATVGYQKIELQPGQFITGRKIAAQETGLSPRQLRTCRAFLENSGKLTVKTTNKYSIITIVNWDSYQRPLDQNDQQNDKQATNKRHYTRINKNNKNKEDCNFDKKKRAGGGGFLCDDFDSVISNDD